MKARELAEFLLREPDRLVQVYTPDGIFIVNGAYHDQFYPEEGPSVVLTVEGEE